MTALITTIGMFGALSNRIRFVPTGQTDFSEEQISAGNKIVQETYIEANIRYTILTAQM